jgi:hypothetical protein
MNFNYASQHHGVLAWDGAAAHPIDIRRHVGISFTFEVTADLAADAVFNVQSAPASDADPCLPGPFVPVPEVLTCTANWGVQALPQATIHIPAGSKKGSICTAGLPCRPDAFVQLVGVGAASVRAVAILSGPK